MEFLQWGGVVDLEVAEVGLLPFILPDHVALSEGE
jgi:hypothetical protein